jgi:hypothetical protein
MAHRCSTCPPPPLPSPLPPYSAPTGRRVRYFTAAGLVETLYRGLAGDSVGRVMENILRAGLVIIDL